MKIIKVTTDKFMRDLYVQVLFTKQWALLQGSLSWCEYGSWPFLQIQFGMNGLISILFQAHKLGISVGFFERTWKLTDFDSAGGVA